MSAAGLGALALVAVGGTTAFAAGYGSPLVLCQAATDGHGGVSVTAIGFDPGTATYVYPGGSGSGSSFTVTGLPAGTTFTSSVSGEYTKTAADGSSTTVKQACSSTIVVGGAASAVTGSTSPAVAGGGGKATDATPVVFSAPVKVSGTTSKAAKAPQVLGESVTRSTGTTAATGVSAGSVSAPSAATSSLAFTGADGVVTTGIVGLALVAGGGAFVMAGRKRSRRTHA